jgi:NitT/TauT family transport system ATP-binding protein
MKPENLIAITNFMYSFGPAFELTISELELRRGEIVFLHGRSGCGKTTLMNLLSGVIPSSLEEMARRTFRLIGYVMHTNTLLPWLNVRQNLAVEGQLRRSESAFRKFEEICERIGLEENVLKLKPAQLSLGMRQRVEIAKALSFEPDLLLLDEALSGIDASTKEILCDIIWEHVQSHSICVVATAHQVTDLLRLAQRIYVMDKGSLCAAITVQDPISERLHLPAKDLFQLAAETLTQEM